MNRYLRFAPERGKRNTVMMSLGPEAPPTVVRASALQRLQTLLRTRTIHAGCKFVGSDGFPAKLLECLRSDLFPTALKALAGES